MLNLLNIFGNNDDDNQEKKENNLWFDFSLMEDEEEKSAFENAKKEVHSDDGLKLSESVSSSHASPQDTARVKYALNQMGYFEDEPTTIPNQKMIDGVKNFQKDNGLDVDGYLKPQGQTITVMNSKLKEIYGTTKYAPGTPKAEQAFIKNQLAKFKEKKEESINQNTLKPTAQSHFLGMTKFSDNNLLTRAREHLQKEENNLPYIYLDTKGKKTVGIGINVDKKDDFMKIDWLKNNRLATEQEKEEAFNIFEQAKERKEYGQKYGAKMYENKSSLRISPEISDKLLNQHLNNDLVNLRRVFTDFDSFPEALQDVLLDIKYNVGNVSNENWPKLHEGIKTKNLDKILKNVHRKDVSEKRNIWAEDKIRTIKKW